MGTTTTSTSNSYGFSKLGSIFGRAPAPHHAQSHAQYHDETWHIPYPANTTRPRTPSAASMPSQYSFFTFDDGQGGIGQSPRASGPSYTNYTSPRDRTSFGSLFNLAIGTKTQHPTRTPILEPLPLNDPVIQSRKGLGLAPIQLPPTQPLRPRAKSSPQISHTPVVLPIPVPKTNPSPPSRHPAARKLSNPSPVTVVQTPQPPLSSRHPYAVANYPPSAPPKSAPPIPTPREQGRSEVQHQLKSVTSTPNLRKESSFARLRRKKSINISTETWCDALVFPRPRLRAHRLSITPPTSPLTPPAPASALLKPLHPANPDATSTVSIQDALCKAVREGEKREKEKEQWNVLASSSFQNARSRSLSRSRRRRYKDPTEEEPFLPEDSKGGVSVVKRGIELLAEKAFLQGASPSMSGSSGGTTAGTHSRNTSVTNTDKKSRHTNTVQSSHQHTNSDVSQGTAMKKKSETALNSALMNPDHTTHLQVAGDGTVESPTFLDLTANKKTMFGTMQDAQPSVTLQDTSTPARIGLAISPTAPPTTASISLPPHPYASPDYVIRDLPHVEHLDMVAPVPPKIIPAPEIASRHRLPPKASSPSIPKPIFTVPARDPSLSPTSRPRVIVARAHAPAPLQAPVMDENLQRRSLLGAFAYADQGSGVFDDAPLGIEEALRRTLRRGSADTTVFNGFTLDTGSPITPTTPLLRPVPTISLPPVPSQFVHPNGPPPPVRYEPVKFDNGPSSGPSTAPRLSPIEDVATPSSGHTLATNASGGSKSYVPSTEPGNDSLTGAALDISNDTLQTTRTEESSSPESEDGPPVLSDNDDPEQYRDLFYQPSLPASPTPHVRIQTANPRAQAEDENREDDTLIQTFRDFGSLREKSALPYNGDVSTFLSSNLEGTSSFVRTPQDLPDNRALTTTEVDKSAAAALWVTQPRSTEIHLAEDFGSPNSPTRLPEALTLGREDFPEDIADSSASSPISKLENVDFTLRDFNHLSMPSITNSDIRPVSTHVVTIDPAEQSNDQSSPLYEELVSASHLHAAIEYTRESSYSAETNDSRMSNIISDFPSPPIVFTPSANPTPSTLLESYFTAATVTPQLRSEGPTPSTVLESYFTPADITPAESADDLQQTLPRSLRESTGTVQ